MSSSWRWNYYMPFFRISGTKQHWGRRKQKVKENKEKEGDRGQKRDSVTETEKKKQSSEDILSAEMSRTRRTEHNKQEILRKEIEGTVFWCLKTGQRLKLNSLTTTLLGWQSHLFGNALWEAAFGETVNWRFPNRLTINSRQNCLQLAAICYNLTSVYVSQRPQQNASCLFTVKRHFGIMSFLQATPTMPKCPATVNKQ